MNLTLNYASDTNEIKSQNSMGQINLILGNNGRPFDLHDTSDQKVILKIANIQGFIDDINIDLSQYTDEALYKGEITVPLDNQVIQQLPPDIYYFEAWVNVPAQNINGSANTNNPLQLIFPSNQYLPFTITENMVNGSNAMPMIKFERIQQDWNDLKNLVLQNEAKVEGLINEFDSDSATSGIAKIAASVVQNSNNISNDESILSNVSAAAMNPSSLANLQTGITDNSEREDTLEDNNASNSESIDGLQTDLSNTSLLASKAYSTASVNAIGEDTNTTNISSLFTSGSSDKVSLQSDISNVASIANLASNHANINDTNFSTANNELNNVSKVADRGSHEAKNQKDILTQQGINLADASNTAYSANSKADVNTSNVSSLISNGINNNVSNILSDLSNTLSIQDLKTLNNSPYFMMRKYSYTDKNGYSTDYASIPQGIYFGKDDTADSGDFFNDDEILALVTNEYEVVIDYSTQNAYLIKPSDNSDPNNRYEFPINKTFNLSDSTTQYDFNSINDGNYFGYFESYYNLNNAPSDLLSNQGAYGVPIQFQQFTDANSQIYQKIIRYDNGTMYVRTGAKGDGSSWSQWIKK